MKEEHRCWVQLPESGRFGWLHKRPCKLPGKVERDGKWYCAKHDPEAVKKRDEERNAALAVTWKSAQQARDRKEEAEKLTEALVRHHAEDGDAEALRICELRGWKIGT